MTAMATTLDSMFKCNTTDLLRYHGLLDAMQQPQCNLKHGNLICAQRRQKDENDIRP